MKVPVLYRILQDFVLLRSYLKAAYLVGITY